MIIICPWCRSKLEIVGQTDLRAPGIQRLKCPVCGYYIWQSSGLIPQRWEIRKVVERHEPPSAVPIELNRTPEIKAKPVWSDFRIIPTSFKESVTGAVKTTGIWIVIVLILVFLILIKLK